MPVDAEVELAFTYERDMQLCCCWRIKNQHDEPRPHFFTSRPIEESQRTRLIAEMRQQAQEYFDEQVRLWVN